MEATAQGIISEKTPTIEISNLVKQYPQTAAPSVNDFSLTCREGEIVGLLGHNASATYRTSTTCLSR